MIINEERSVGSHLTLSKDVRLHVAVVVLAGPHEGAGGLEHLGYHVVNESVLVPDLQLLKLRLVVPGGHRERKRGSTRYGVGGGAHTMD